MFLQVVHISVFHVVAALVVFFAFLVFITSKKLSHVMAAMLGAALFVLFHILNQNEALQYINFNTIGLLMGMMICVAVIRKSGLFEYVAIKGLKWTKGNPWKILVALSLITGVVSAFLDNATTVLIMVPLTFAVTDTIDIDPMPILISEIICSNIGGAATLIGAPPNMLIGSEAGLDFMAFLNNNFMVALMVGMGAFFMLKLHYYKKLNKMVVNEHIIMAFDEKKTIKNKKYLVKSLIAFSFVILAFATHHIHHLSLASVALGGGFIMMAINKEDPEELLKEVHWPTIFFFMGLFIMVGGLEKVGVLKSIADKIMVWTHGESAATSQFVLWMSAISTTVINSIPFTATMIPVVNNMADTLNGDVEPIWWALSLGACFGGNGTLIGAAANIIVVGITQKTAHPMRFVQYLKVALPITLMSTIIASIYLYVRYFL